MTADDLARLLVNRREAQGMNRKEASDLCGVSYWTITHWEHGECLHEHIELLRYLSRLGVELRVVGNKANWDG